MEKAGVDDIDFSPLEGANLCVLVDPMPDELEGIVSSSPNKYRYRNKETGEIYKGDELFREVNRDDYEQVNLSPEEIAELRAKHGAADWYEWCPEHWGSKWGAYELEVRELGGDGSPVLVEFQTAWDFLKPQIMRKIEIYLYRNFFLSDFYWVGNNPYNDSKKKLEVSHD